MRLLLFNLATGGPQVALAFTASWVRALAPYYSAVDVVTIHHEFVALPSNVTVHSTGREKGQSRVQQVANFYRILYQLYSASEKPSVCFAHMNYYFPVLAQPFFRLYRTPYVLWYAHRVMERLARLSARMAYRVVSTTSDGIAGLGSPALGIGHGIDTDVFSPARENPSTASRDFVSVGRISPIKRLETIIEAFAAAYPQLPAGARLRLIGPVLSSDDESYRQRLIALSAQALPAFAVSFEDAIPYERIHQAYRDAWCAINVCDTSALDKALLEAMSCGALAIGNERYRSVLGAAEAGFLTTDGTVQDLSRAILAAGAMGDEQRSVIGRALRQEVIAHHSLGRLAGVLSGLLNEAVSATERRSVHRG